MKNNQPVSQKEKSFIKGLIIVSKTDLKGIITYVNDAFVEMSGFTREELIGKNHNMVRHPDMPLSAFKWLWNTLNDGLPWRGMVKNRCKNGDHYWVKALVSPIKEQGRVIGYLSVRCAPDRSEISGAEALYKQLNQTGAAIESKFERFKFKNLSLNLKLQLLIQPILFVLLASVSYFFYVEMKISMLESARQRAEATAVQVIDSSNMLMITGMISIPENRQMMIKKIIEGQQLKSLRLLRTDQVVKQFGPGLPEEQLVDPLVTEVIQTAASKGKSVPYYAESQIDGKTLFRAITPYIALRSFHGTNCLSCHTVAEGSVNGASDITIDLTAEIDKLQYFLKILLALQIILQLFIFTVLRFSFRKFVEIPLNGMESQFEEVIEGNLNSEINISGRDEVGILFCKLQVMQSQIKVMLDEMSLAASIIMARSTELDTKIQQVTNYSSNQRNDIQTISRTMDDFSKSVLQVSRDAHSSAGAAFTSQELIEESNLNMQNTIKSTGRVVDAVKASSNSINDLKQAIQEIGLISKTIKDIAGQTNLLALNAAIEAARAGEQGRGFAVVADEVRKLAERTSSSTKDIADMVSNIQTVNENVVHSMNQAIREVEEEVITVQSNGEILKKVIETSRQVTDNAQRIASVSQKQSIASDSVSSSLVNVASLVDSNVQIAEQAKMASQTLSKSAQALQDMIRLLNR